jgi:hypothetical protein
MTGNRRSLKMENMYIAMLVILKFNTDGGGLRTIGLNDCFGL